MDDTAGDLMAISPPHVIRKLKEDEQMGSPQTVTLSIEDGGKTEVSQPSGLPLPSKARTIALVVTLTGAAFLNSLTVQSAVIVLPTIGKELDIPEARQQWIISAYTLTFGCFLLLWGRLADIYGKRLIFMWGCAWVTVTTIVIPFSPNEICFDVLRGLQGLGAAANVPTAIGILGVTFPPGKAKNYAFSFYSAGAPLGSVFGNLLGGIVAEYASWKWIFWILACLAAAVTIAGYLIVPVPVVNTGTKTSVDWVGGTLITMAILAFMFAMTEGNVVGWSTPWIPVLIVVSVILIALFVFWQLYLEKKTTRSPLMKVTVFRNIHFSAAMVIMLLFFASFNNFLVFATYFYQDYQGLSIIQTTLRFIPTGVVGICTCFVTAYILSRIRGNYILMFGTVCIGVTRLLFAVPIPPHTTYWAFGFPAMCLAVFGADTLYPSLTLFTAQSLPQADQALGGALINAVGQIGRAIGLAIGTAVQTAVERKHGVAESSSAASGSQALLEGLRAAAWLDLALAAAAFLVVISAFRGAGKLGAIRK
ncbi:major facilitator superfamily domain-containing protein [Cryomyces antarcticus]